MSGKPDLDIAPQPTPLLSERWSGVPSRLTSEASTARTRLYSNKTLPHSAPRQRPARLPPGLSESDFSTAVKDLRQSIGAENVVINDQPLKDGWYLEHPNTHDAFHVVEQEELVCSAVVYPGSTEEVQKVVRWANKHLIPIYPISIGRNVGYGGAAPRVPGGVVLDLGKRMHSILNVDGENASCMVEPGVTYFKLYEEIQNRGLPLWIDCPDLGGGSVLGNAIDRGVGYTPAGDHFANHCGMEIVLPNGELLRTGMGAIPGPDGTDSPVWQSFQNSFGPKIDGVFSQSNFGIVTKMGFWLLHEMPHRSYCFTFAQDEDFPRIVEAIRPLAQKGVLGNIPQLRHVVQELNVTGRRKSTFHDGEGPMTREEIRRAAKELPLGDCSWVFYGTQYGDAQSVERQLGVVKAAFSDIEGTKFWLPEDVPQDHYLHSRVQVNSGVPILRELDWLNWLPNAGHLFFSPITPTRGKDAQKIHDMIVAGHKKYGFDVFPTLCIAGREMHYIANVIFDRADADQKRRAVALLRELVDDCAKEGFGEYRTHLLFQDQVARTYGWGDQALMRFNETIKDALDPNGILAPGRCGIWPKRFRGRGWELGLEDVDMKVIGPKL
ncbi:uncharacterized protein LTR77_001453 [Saxophila tyrrhenica]|uniref:FAD-binding PCMH-type domain-containing protein n=1 Tax=Saxophila tyrrhenica TaxID=1690608 RepID=A0AAV9PKH9_9PEZI|nr:hypothetical protein LTR77_001453 [Saxophila tyrrhenica]